MERRGVLHCANAGGGAYRDPRRKGDDMKKYYCAVCGEVLIPHPDAKGLPQRFDPLTGEQLNLSLTRGYMICPTGKCGHWGIDHINKYPGFFAALFGSIEVTCERPGCDLRRKMSDGL